MDDIVDFMRIYIEDINVLGEVTDEIAMDLENNIKEEAPYDQGRLRRSIRVDTRIYENYSIITGYWDEGLAPHGIYVLAGTGPVQGKLMKMPWGYRMSRKGTEANDFLGRGLEQTVRMYR